MDLNARVTVIFARVDENFQTATPFNSVIYLFFILIPINNKVLLILDTKYQRNIPSHFGERNLNAWVDVNFFRVDVIFKRPLRPNSATDFFSF